jgi:voltage-gated potassium channel
MLALPVGIIASAFAREIHRRDFVVTWTMLARVPIFAGLGPGDLAEVMRHLRSQSCEPDEIIVRRGERADSMFIIASGEVLVDLRDGSVRLGPGHFFGEIAVLERSERTATVRAVTRCKLLVLEAYDLQLLMDRSPVMAQRIREVAGSRKAEGRSRRGSAPPDA